MSYNPASLHRRAFLVILVSGMIWPETITPGAPFAFMFGQVVDMFYFPLFTWPEQLPLIGGNIFFAPVFNFADACISCSVVALFVFYRIIIFFNFFKHKRSFIIENLINQFFNLFLFHDLSSFVIRNHIPKLCGTSYRQPWVPHRLFPNKASSAGFRDPVV